MSEAVLIPSQRLMAENRAPWLDRLVDNLPVRFGLVLLTALVIAAVCPLIFLTNRILPAALMKFTSAGMLGLSAGFASRSLLHRYSRFLRLLSSWVAAIAAFLLIGSLTQGFVGLTLPIRVVVIPTWDTAGQVCLGLVTAWLALQACKPGKKFESKLITLEKKKISHPAPKKPIRDSNPKPTKQPKRVINKLPPRTLIQLQSNTLGRQWLAGCKAAGSKFLDVQNRVRSLVFGASRKFGSLVNQTQVKLDRRWRPLKKRIRLANRRTEKRLILRNAAQVKLVGKTENRCPYCLEIVEKNDPRGVTICPICHTPHHADCWAVTGACQVPHYQE